MKYNGRLLHIDFETTSRLDLGKVGASRYSRDPSTVVLCVAWAFDDEPTQSFILPPRNWLPVELCYHLMHGGAFAAWNTNFETSLLENYFDLRIDHAQTVCAMQRALYAGLPAKLEKAGPALKLGIVKDMVGERLMKQMMKPRKDGSFWHNDPVEGPAKLDRLADYCRTDVEAERAVMAVIPDLPDSEKEVSKLDFEANRRGIRLDLPLIEKLIDIAGTATKNLNGECLILTKGAVSSPGTQRDKLLNWLRNEGMVISDLGKESVAETLETPTHPGATRVVLSIRQKVSKSSVAKLQAMLRTVDADERVRGTLQYYGAGRTGRWSGRQIQPQNFPRPEGYANAAVDGVMQGLDAEGLRLFYGEPLDVVSSCLRGCLIPEGGKTFFVYDLAQIEARVLAWLADQNDVLDAFRAYDSGATKADIYEFTATKLGLGSRPAGKVAVLGLGYGMGHVHFVDFAKGYGVRLTPEESADIVFNWREANPMIRKFWWGLDAAAKRAIEHPGLEVVVGRTKLKVRDSYGRRVMLIRLPSGRLLYYRNPRLDTDPVKPQYEFDHL